MAGRRRPSRGPGGRRTRLLEPNVHERLIFATQQGSPVPMAAAYAGIGERTFLDWMMRGRIEEERVTTAGTDGQMPAPLADEAPFLKLYREVVLARANAGVRNVLHIQRAAAGGFVVEETTETDPDGTTRKTVKKAPPDWRAAAFMLERTHPAQFGKNAVQLEVSGMPAPAVEGAADGPGGAVGGVDAADLAQRLVANFEALRQAGALPAAPGYEDVQDAEVIQD